MDTLYIVMPAYNEEENIESVIKEWYKKLENSSQESKLVIADSGSSDKTHYILLGLQKKGYTQLQILEDTDKFHGPKVIALYKYAIAQGADYIFQTDSDGQTNPQEFDYFWMKRREFDCVLGERCEREDGKDRAFVEKVVCFLLRVIFSVKVPDANAPFRLMKSNIVNKYILRLPDDYNIPNIMLTTYFAFYKENITFIPVTFKPRQGGVNSINLKKIVVIGWNALGDFVKFRKGMKNHENF